jgi:II/X family phage/plasmid replication protein
MLIDWITAYLPMTNINPESWERLRTLTDRVTRYCPRTGEIRWESTAWDSVRSDSHQIAMRVGSDAIWIQGSPARVCGSGDAVFGEGASSAIDLTGCLARMIAFVTPHIGVYLTTDYLKWHVTRVDITGNLLLENLAAVRVALRILRDCEGGRYRVSQQAGDTVYWSHTSRLRSGKAYAKGPQIEYQTNKPDYTGRSYTEQEKQQANRLLRLELRLGAQWFREKLGEHWSALKPEDLENEWRSYFNRMIGAAELTDENTLPQRFQDVAKTPGRGKSAYGCFLLIKSVGWEKARDSYSKSTWYDHLAVMRKAGLGDADIAVGNIVQLRRKVLECQLVGSWDELRHVA